jgi:limonene-1,2-epoxide hydrolase
MPVSSASARSQQSPAATLGHRSDAKLYRCWAPALPACTVGPGTRSALVCTDPPLQQEESMTDTSALDVVNALIRGWEALDADTVAACFSEDGVWHNMPYPPIQGRTAIADAIRRFVATATDIRFVIRHLGEVAPGIVVSERNDLFTLKDGRTVDIPVMGVFDVTDGKITAWRDYFDPAAMPS